MFGFRKKSKDEEEYIELFPQPEEQEDGKLIIEIEKLTDYIDSDRIQRKLRGGSILFINIRELKEKDINELKRAIARIKKTCIAINGDIVGVGEDWIIATPSTAKISRQKVEVVEKVEEEYVSPFSKENV